MSNFHTTPTRLGPRPNIPQLPATPESQILSSPIATNFSSPTPSYWGTPAAGGIWPQTTSSSFGSNQLQNNSSNSNVSETASTILEAKLRAAQQDSGKRGRPRADHISHLILEGTSSPSGIKCRVCNRIFPREKSLQAHLRTHTGERPYMCDYPNCIRAFTQSGQLKTHQRLHAGEKPFVCSSPGCGNRYTHANRTCPVHPYHKPQRSTELVLQPNISAGENTEEVQNWLESYRKERLDKTPGKTPTNSISITGDTPIESPPPHQQLDLGLRTASTDILAHELCKRSRIKRGLVSELEQENISQIPPTKAMNLSSKFLPSSPLSKSAGLNLIQPSNTANSTKTRRTLGDITPKKDKNILPPEPIDNLSNIIPLSPVKSLNPKKRWIKTVVREQNQAQFPTCSREIVLTSPNKADDENLAQPIRWNENDTPLNPIPIIRRPHRPNSPVNWSVVSALVDLGQSTPQPLNLSTSGTRRPS